jgi:hypothetical protein
MFIILPLAEWAVVWFLVGGRPNDYNALAEGWKALSSVFRKILL